jgi:hypothetical protein
MRIPSVSRPGRLVMILCTASSVIVGVMIIPNANGATIPRPVIPSRPCATFDITGHPSTGMAWDEPVTFCGTGIKPGTWVCVAKSPVIKPGSALNCTMSGTSPMKQTKF